MILNLCQYQQKLKIQKKKKKKKKKNSQKTTRITFPDSASFLD